MAAKILVTGATGFIGRALLEYLRCAGYDVLGSVRTAKAVVPGSIIAPELSAISDWREVLTGRDSVVHAAARAHVLKETEQDPLAVFRRVNTVGTMNLARQAADAGVRRFVFFSSIGVNGLSTRDGECFTEQSLPAPHNHYAISKWEAEIGLREIESETGMEVVILRPPLVYGPGVGANFLRLMHTVAKGWPLPLGGVENRRSLLYLGNFTDAVRLCLEHPAAAGKTFLLADGEDISSAELVRRLARAMNRPARLLPVPMTWLRVLGVLIRRSAEMDRLLGSLAVDSSKIRSELGWQPPFSLDEGLRQTVAYFLQHLGQVDCRG